MTGAEQQPEVQWVFPPKRKRHPGRVILLILLIVVVLAVAAGAVYLALPKAPEPTATPTPTASASSSSSPSPTPTPTASAGATPTPGVSQTPEPTVTEEPVENPEIAAFRATVSPVLADARTGLDIIASSDAATAAQIAGDLIGDAQNLADRTAPVDLDQRWREGVAAYLGALTSLQSTANAGGDTASDVSAAGAALDALNTLIG